MESLHTGEFILFWCILDYDKGSGLFKLFRELGGTGGTIFLGRGTVNNRILNILGVLDSRKEIFLAVIDKNNEDVFYDAVINRFSLNKPNHGIAFSMPVKYYSKAADSKIITNPGERGISKMRYEAIFVIVDKGSKDDVLEAAESAGSTGGTVIHGRGSGTREKETLFNIHIEPEKDIVLILTKTDKTEPIVKAVTEKLNLEKPGKGIIFVMDISRAEGLYQEN